MAYGKHQFYLDDYPVESGVVKLPDKCNWLVFKHVGSVGFTNNPEEKGDICLILNETRSVSGGFWSVMSFLTKDEARELSKALAKYSK